MKCSQSFLRRVRNVLVYSTGEKYDCISPESAGSIQYVFPLYKNCFIPKMEQNVFNKVIQSGADCIVWNYDSFPKDPYSVRTGDDVISCIMSNTMNLIELKDTKYYSGQGAIFDQNKRCLLMFGDSYDDGERIHKIFLISKRIFREEECTKPVEQAIIKRLIPTVLTDTFAMDALKHFPVEVRIESLIKYRRTADLPALSTLDRDIETSVVNNMDKIFRLYNATQ